MPMPRLTITSRPITKSSAAYLLLENESQSLEKYVLELNMPICITITNSDTKRCVGWYDIATHTNHICSQGRLVDAKYDSCFECRKKTGFNPAFYNTTDISSMQAEYNTKPHSVYVSYFGGGIAKAGIMSDSRGLDRIYEQGALFYCVIGSFADATKAHREEARLIAGGLKNSVSKRQKEKVLAEVVDINVEQKNFYDILKNLNLDGIKIVSNLDHFFFGSYPKESIELIGDNPISGKIRGVVGRYLILNNNDRLYGTWLSNLSGFAIEILKEEKSIKAEPKQVSLFS